jgi:hypothetical protein
MKIFTASLNLARIGALFAVGSIAFGLAPAGCIGGWEYSNVPEGDRCNPYNSHNECGSGLQCTVSSWQVANQTGTSSLGTPALALQQGAGVGSAGFNVLAFCPENYCCPVDGDGNLTTSGNPNCQAGCNGGAAQICAAIGDTTAPYVGVCDFAASGVLPAADGGSEEASTPADGSSDDGSSGDGSSGDGSSGDGSSGG